MDMYHILVVEDDQDINRLLCRILTDGGYDVRPLSPAARPYCGRSSMIMIWCCWT